MTLSELRAACEAEIAEATAHLAKAGSLVFDALADMQQTADLESLTPDETAKLLKRCVDTIYRMGKDGRLDIIGGRVTRQSLKEFQEGKRTKGGTDRGKKGGRRAKKRGNRLLVRNV
jgi:hypothetical protein